MLHVIDSILVDLSVVVLRCETTNLTLSPLLPTTKSSALNNILH